MAFRRSSTACRSPTAEAEEAAIAAGAQPAWPSNKIDHGRLIARCARRRRGAGQVQPPAPRADDSPRATRFGDATIRGYRCVSQIAENPVSSVYLAESERSGEQVVAQGPAPAAGRRLRGEDL